MSELKIVTVPDPILFQGWNYTPSTEEAIDLGVKMLGLMEKADGVGLAAQQVGLRWAMFVMSESGRASDGKIVLNPRITRTSDFGAVGIEGCLSIPGVSLGIKRFESIDATWYDEKGKLVMKKLTGKPARIFQHEMDHLNGILISDRFEDQQRGILED